MKAEVEEATKYHSLCVGEEAQRAHLSLSPLPPPLSIYINVLGSDTEIQTVFCQGRQSGGG